MRGTSGGGRFGRWAALAAVALALGGPAATSASPTGPGGDDPGAVPAAAPTATRRVGSQRLVAPAQVADDGLGTTGTTTYTVDLVNRAIHVAVDLTATNLAPGTATRYTYFDAVGVFAQAEATNVVATTADGRPLGAAVEPIEGTEVFAFIRVDLADDLLYQETHGIRLTYDLPDQGARSPRITRVNPSFAAVLTLPFGDPGAAAVRVLVPDGLDVEVLGLSVLTEEDAGDHRAFHASGIADPIGWDANVVARDLDALERTDPGGEHDVEVAAWPGDAEWSEFVGGLVRDGLPLMQDLIAQPWPVDGTLDIIETVAPYLYGYAGWYDSQLERIEVGDELDPAVVLHELAHAWFDRDLFAERWINEGFAEVVSSRALAQLGLPAPPPGPIDPAAIGAIRLAEWSTPALASSISEEQEAYGYNAAHGVIRAITDEIGPEALAAVVGAASDDELAYQGDPDPEGWRGDTGWRRFLDLTEELGGSTVAGPLFAAHVVPDVDLPLLATRTEARAAYDGLEATGAGWTPPLAVRRAMAEWEFGEATRAMGLAGQVVALRDEILAAVEPLDLELTGLERDYERARDLPEVVLAAEALAEVAPDLVEAHRRVEGDHGLVSRVGLLGGGLDDGLAAADEALRDGDAARVASALREVASDLDAAERAGLRRIGGLVAALLIAGSVLQGRRALALGLDGGVVGTALSRVRRRGRPDPGATARSPSRG